MGFTRSLIETIYGKETLTNSFTISMLGTSPTQVSAIFSSYGCTAGKVLFIYTFLIVPPVGPRDDSTVIAVVVSCVAVAVAAAVAFIVVLILQEKKGKVGFKIDQSWM